LYSAVRRCISILLILSIIVAARTTQHRKHMSHVGMRVYWPAVQEWAWRGQYEKHLFCFLLQPLGADHSRKHSLSIAVWRHRVRENMFSVRHRKLRSYTFGRLCAVGFA
jgi:hypothetical protein